MSSSATIDHPHGEEGRKSVVVTGGGSGIGLAMARHFASRGHLVAILDVDANSGAKVVTELSSECPNAKITFKKCDVSSWAEQAAVFKEVFTEHGDRIDIVLANAGISEQGETSSVNLVEELPSEPRLGAINVNLIGVIYCKSGEPGRFEIAQLTSHASAVKLASHYMNKGKADPSLRSRGSIICTASNAGFYPFPTAPLYAASKAGVIGLVRALAPQLERAKIQINGLAPAVLGEFDSLQPVR